MDTTAYLQRIGYQGAVAPDGHTLRALQLAHLLTVPFENLDIGWGREIVLDEGRILQKIVDERRGGFCYEVNGAFAALLRSVGFPVDLLSAGVARKSGGFGPDYDHLVLRIDLAEPWLVDVGFGDSFREPLRLIPDLVQEQAFGGYRFKCTGETWTLWQREQQEWKPQYRFTLQPRTFDDFAAMCVFQQTAPESSFTQRRICTIATPSGRITLADRRLIITADGQRDESELSDEAAFGAALQRYFGIIPPNN
ncbi:MAG: arylamine N-acetyltransferase [Ktedonobacterales bacterium]|nr:arylamine N-acetyltransferase [Ktedonobacterales bacterium]